MRNTIEDFIPNKYYECLYHEDNILKIIYYFKCKKHKRKSVKCFYYIENDKYYNEQCKFDLELSDSIFKEIDLSIIANYLPIGHPDKILFRKERISCLLK